jgi:hypothetical protein
MSAQDNLSSAQFPDNYPKGKPLKSKWVPDITDRRDLDWHILQRHVRFSESKGSSKETPIWAKNVAPARNGMNDAEFHQHLHDVGHFDKDSEHEHFTPKKGRS